jgi:hypothetical protein
MANVFQTGLWICHPVIQLLIAGMMLRRQLHKTFPVFFTYIVSQILIFAVIFPAHLRHNYWIYFYLYWASAALSSVLGFMVIHEVFLDVFRPYHTLRDLGSVLFKWTGLVMLLVAGVVSISSSDSDLLPWMHAILVAQRCVRLVQCGLVFFLLAFAGYLGVNRKQKSFGIALGFGVFAICELAVVASWVGNHLNPLAMNLVNKAAYDSALLVWFGYVLAESPVRQLSATLLQSQRWEEGLTDIQHPLPADSLIPMFEGMVDRALARTQPSPEVVAISHKAATAGRESKAIGAAAALPEALTAVASGR